MVTRSIFRSDLYRTPVTVLIQCCCIPLTLLLQACYSAVRLFSNPRDSAVTLLFLLACDSAVNLLLLPACDGAVTYYYTVTYYWQCCDVTPLCWVWQYYDSDTRHTCWVSQKNSQRLTITLLHNGLMQSCSRLAKNVVSYYASCYVQPIEHNASYVRTRDFCVT